MLPARDDAFPTTFNVTNFHTTKLFADGQWRWLLGNRDVTGCVGFTTCRITSVNHDVRTNRTTIALHDGTCYYTFITHNSKLSFAPRLHTICTFYFQIVASHYYDHIMPIDLVPIASQNNQILWSPQSDDFCSALLDHWKHCVRYYLTQCHPPHTDHPIPGLPTPYHFIHNESIDPTQIIRKIRHDGGPQFGCYLEYCGVDITNHLIYTTPRMSGVGVCPNPSHCESAGHCSAVEPVLYKLQINKLSKYGHYTLNVSTRFPPTHDMTLFDHKFIEGSSNLNGEDYVKPQCFPFQQNEKEEEKEQQQPSQPSQPFRKFGSPCDDPDAIHMGASDDDDEDDDDDDDDVGCNNDEVDENGFVYMYLPTNARPDDDEDDALDDQ